MCDTIVISVAVVTLVCRSCIESAIIYLYNHTLPKSLVRQVMDYFMDIDAMELRHTVYKSAMKDSADNLELLRGYVKKGQEIVASMDVLISQLKASQKARLKAGPTAIPCHNNDIPYHPNDTLAVREAKFEAFRLTCSAHHCQFLLVSCIAEEDKQYKCEQIEQLSM